MKINWFKINTKDIFNYLADWIYYNNSSILSKDLYKYLKIGYYCKDCNNKFRFCKCEEHQDTNFFKIIYYNISEYKLLIIIDKFLKIVENHGSKTDNEKEKYIKYIMKKIYED